MTAKEYLRQLQGLSDKERRLEQEISRLRDDLYHAKAIRYDKDLIQSSPVNAQEESIIRIADAELRLIEIKASYHDLYVTILDQIDGLPNTRYRDVLAKRYIDGKAFWKIAEEMGYVTHTIEKMHGYALHEFANRYNIK